VVAAMATRHRRRTCSSSRSTASRAGASSAHHQAADGYCMSNFFHAWADAVRANNGAPAPPLEDDGGLLPPRPYGPGAIVPRRPPRCEFEHS